MDHQGLGQAGHPFEDAVPAGEDGDQELIDDLVLPDDLPAICRADLLVGRAQLVQFGEVGLFGRGAHDRVPGPGDRPLRSLRRYRWKTGRYL